MELIEAFAPSHIYGDWCNDFIVNKYMGTTPITILPGHLAESLRWRKVGEEEPEEEKLYKVDGLGVCRFGFDGDGDRVWISHEHGSLSECEDHDLYRLEVAGIDYVET
jgi:hypothetical protein